MLKCNYFAFYQQVNVNIAGFSLISLVPIVMANAWLFCIFFRLVYAHRKSRPFIKGAMGMRVYFLIFKRKCTITATTLPVVLPLQCASFFFLKKSYPRVKGQGNLALCVVFQGVLVNFFLAC